MKHFGTSIQILSRCFQYIAMICLAVMVAMNAWEITARYLWGSSFRWIQEISLLLISWTVFMGFTQVVINKQDIAVDYFVNLMPQKGQTIIRVVNDFFLAISYMILLVITIQMVISHATQTTLIMGMPKYLYTLPLVCMLTVLSLNSIYLLFKWVVMFQNSKQKNSVNVTSEFSVRKEG
ncbi:TRAP transporter small permease [Halobacillus litoralis]|uniref:TRAP transporter small permease n=1 Tax=Halobacillus litoralis TaxID=45668 RepID=UPI00249029C7|nr:TRAP transporter small permease [Halobacillus litoralis]